MRALLDELQDRLRAFLDQDEQVLLVVEVHAATNGLVVKALDDIDQDDPHLFWMFVDDFVTAPQFVDLIARRVWERREVACKVLEKQKEPLWPPLPREVYDASVTPVARMRAFMLYARDLSSDLDEMHLVWSLFPGAIADPAAYRAFVLELMAHQFPSPWCHHMRVLVRDESTRPALRDVGTVVRGSDWYAPRLSPDDIEQSVRDQASNEALSLDERIPALLTLAGLDYSHGRLPDALGKYKIASQYYGGTGRDALYALSLNGMGEALARAGQFDAAKMHFESALTPALRRIGQEDEPGRLDAAPVLLNIALNLGNLHLTARRWAEAGAYYVGAKDLAKALINAQVMIQCCENIGACHYELGQYPEAAKAWEEGTTLARSIQAEEHLRALLHRQRSAYDRLGLVDHRDAVDAELRTLGPNTGAQA